MNKLTNSRFRERLSRNLGGHKKNFSKEGSKIKNRREELI
jgi:hypothetical protein